MGHFEIVKDVFNRSARSSEDLKQCCQCSKKGGSGGTKGSKGGAVEEFIPISEFKNKANDSGNQIFKTLSPQSSPMRVFENQSPNV